MTALPTAPDLIAGISDIESRTPLDVVILPPVPSFAGDRPIYLVATVHDAKPSWLYAVGADGCASRMPPPDGGPSMAAGFVSPAARAAWERSVPYLAAAFWTGRPARSRARLAVSLRLGLGPGLAAVLAASAPEFMAWLDAGIDGERA
jgi:hypothetical protein